MREETRQLDYFQIVSDGLSHATGRPFGEAVEQLRAVKEYAKYVVDRGLAEDYLFAMERSGLGEMAELLLYLARR
jgi:hypothetical protein